MTTNVTNYNQIKITQRVQGKAPTMQSSYKFLVNKGHKKSLKEIFYFC